MENEEEEDEIFTTLQGGYEEQEDEEEKEEEEPEAERKSSWDVPIPSRSVASRRASLPCPVSTQYFFVCVKTPVAMGQAVDLSYRRPASG